MEKIYKFINAIIIILLMAITVVSLIGFLFGIDKLEFMMGLGFASVSIISAIGLIVAAFAPTRTVLIIVAVFYLLLLGLIGFCLFLYIKKDKSAPILTFVFIDIILTLLLHEMFYSNYLMIGLAIKIAYFVIWLVYSRVKNGKSKV